VQRSQLGPLTFVNQSDLAALRALSTDWGSRVLDLDGRGMHDDTTFLARARADLPMGEGLTPRSWDGFIDALWWGLSALEDAPTDVDLVWTDAHHLLHAGLHHLYPALHALRTVAGQVATTEHGFPREVVLKVFVVGDDPSFPPLPAADD
jgi:hypothetical protein